MSSEGRKNTWLADVVGVHRGTITKWRNGDFMPSAEKQTAVAGALGRKVDDLFFLPTASGVRRAQDRKAAA